MNIIYQDSKLYPCPYKDDCPLEVGTDTCLCKAKVDYYNDKEKDKELKNALDSFSSCLK